MLVCLREMVFLNHTSVVLTNLSPTLGYNNLILQQHVLCITDELFIGT